MPADAQLRRAVDSLVAFSPTLERAGWGLLGGTWSFSNGAALQAAIREWAGAVSHLAASISAHGGPFLVGPAPTLADCALAPFVARFDLAARRCRSYDARASSTHLAAYLEALEATDALGATFTDRGLFGDAIARYTSLDYFDHTTASLRDPLPA